MNACVIFLLAPVDPNSRKASFSHKAGPLSRVDSSSAPFCSHTFFEWGFASLQISWGLVGHREMIENVYMSGQRGERVRLGCMGRISSSSNKPVFISTFFSSGALCP